jgi:NAD(P)H-flavin reductase
MMRFTALELERRGVAAQRIYLSMERNMKCGIGLCGHCQYGPTFVCKDGPVYRYDAVSGLLALREI